MSNLDNQPDPSRTEVQRGNAQAEVMRKLIRSKFPRTYRLLNGVRFQLPARRPTGAEHEHTGRQLPGHWRAGHWRRQAFGEGSLQRKLIWIQPYKTTAPDA